MTFTSPFDEHEDDHRHGSLPWKDTKDALTKVASADPITGDGSVANPLGLSLSVNPPITGDGSAANPLGIPTLCESIGELQPKDHDPNHYILAFSPTGGLPIPSHYVGYDVDVAGQAWAGGSLANFYVHAFEPLPIFSPLPIPIWGGAVALIQQYLDSAMVAAGFFAGDAIWSVNGNSITIWAQPYIPMVAPAIPPMVPYPQFLHVGTSSAVEAKYSPAPLGMVTPPATAGDCYLVKASAWGTTITYPLTIDGIPYPKGENVMTILAALATYPNLWQSVLVPGAVGGATQTRLIANPTKVVVDDVLGNVGINHDPTQYDLAVGGEVIIYPSATATPNIRQKSAAGSIVSYGELIDGVTTAPATPYLAIDFGPVQSVALAYTADYRVRRGGTAAKQVGGQIYLLVTSAGVISRLDVSSYSPDLIDEVVAGIDPATNRIKLFLNAKSTLSWTFDVYARTEGMETAGVPVRWTWSQIASLPAYATFIGDIRNTFWQNLTKGRLEFSRITNGVAQGERRVWDINGFVTATNSWAEINTHYIPAVDGAAGLGVEIRQRAGMAAGTASGQLSFSVTGAGVFSNVDWESHGGRLPTNVRVGLNATGEVVILYRDTGPGGYAIHTEVYGHTITQKQLWDLTTFATDPSPAYTSFVNATIRNGFGVVTATGTVTASGFIIASDAVVKEEIADFTPDLAKSILTGIKVGTWKYKAVMGKGEVSAGVTDAGALRKLLPSHLQDALTPIKQHALDETKPDELTDVTYINTQLITAALLVQAQTAMAELTVTQKELEAANKTIAALQKQVADVLARLAKAKI